MRHGTATANTPRNISDVFASFFERVYEEDDGEGHFNKSSTNNAGFSQLQFTMSEVESAKAQELTEAHLLLYGTARMA
jgi:hypothetical protein